MRTRLLSLSLFALAVALPGMACSSSSEDDAEASEDALTDDELARKSLQILGAKIDGAEQQCNRCHDINQATLKKWADDYKTSLTFLSDDRKTQKERRNYMRRDPADETSTFAPAKLGFLSAGTHFGGSAAVDERRHPIAAKQSAMLKKIFTNRDADYAQFRSNTLMPIEAEYDRLSAGDYNTIATWIEKGMPKLEQLLPEEPRPTTCADDFDQLKAHAREMKSKGWEAVNREGRMPMFACDAGASPLECFRQKHDGKDIFPDAKTSSYGKDWAQDGSTVRVLRALDYKTFFWMRNSADGRFIANGMSGGGSDGAVIADLAAALAPGGPKTRDIMASARYDPDFWPDNKGFMFQGTPSQGVFCAQSLLSNPATTRISFSEPQCSKLDTVGLYQTVGQRIGDNSVADHFVVNGKFASDNPGQTASDRDLAATFGPDAKAIIRVMFARGNDAEDGYQVKQSVELPTPFEGDIMMSRSSTLLGARVAGEDKPLGYSIRKVSSTFQGDGYRFQLSAVGRICMPGNKANFSFDERFLTTHHYLEREDFASDAAWAGYKEKGGADIYVADFVTGKKVRITRMKPGQFAIFPHFRSDGWLYFLVRDASDPNDKKEFVVASDWALKQLAAVPTP
ncbi:MAG: hypothetical protein KF819_03840 [Labilithrix sp.]|nr:hypothetical protein [Labilithrix sp.]